MRGKKLRISSEDEAGEEIIGLGKTIISSSASFFSSKSAIFLSLITNYIFHNEYLKLILFSKIVYILHFITHVKACMMKYLLFVTHVKALKTNPFLLDNSVEIRLISRMCYEKYILCSFKRFMLFHLKLVMALRDF